MDSSAPREVPFGMPTRSRADAVLHSVASRAPTDHSSLAGCKDVPESESGDTHPHKTKNTSSSCPGKVIHMHMGHGHIRHLHQVWPTTE